MYLISKDLTPGDLTVAPLKAAKAHNARGILKTELSALIVDVFTFICV